MLLDMVNCLLPELVNVRRVLCAFAGSSVNSADIRHDILGVGQRGIGPLSDIYKFQISIETVVMTSIDGLIVFYNLYQVYNLYYGSKINYVYA